MTSFIVISDTHNHSLKDILGDMTADVLIHCGDWTMHGEWTEVEMMKTYLKEIRPQFKRILAVAGNHDFCFKNFFFLERKLKKELDVDFLKDEVITVLGHRVFGSPWVPEFGPWAFMYPRPTKRWLSRPQADICIHHGPPYGILDKTPIGEEVGCWDLKDSLLRLNPKPKVVCFGHIHHSSGVIEVEGVKFINASICNERYSPVNPPRFFEL